MKKLWLKLIDSLESETDLVMATVIQHKGSAPRGAGAWMIIYRNGNTSGTVGGGLLEAKVFDAARDAFKKQRPQICKLDMTQQELTSANMICGGKVEVLVDYLKIDDYQQRFFREIRSAIENRDKARLITQLDFDGPDELRVGHFLLKASGELIANVENSNSFNEAVRQKTSALEKPQLLEIESKSYWVEPLSTEKRLYIFGAGHVGRAVAPLAYLVDFDTQVFDDRQEFVNHDYFPETIGLNCIDQFSRCLESQEIDENSYLLIVTRGHMHDRDILAQALRTQAAYIGMIGSRRKRDTIYKNLLESGFDESDLKRVYSPVGIDILAETPEEIAVSIVAELIKIRAQKVKT
jgi:xanthine dehydrogenase accessory factor